MFWEFGQWDKSHPGVLPNHGKWFGAGQPAGRPARQASFGAILTKIPCQNFARCIFFEKVTLLHFLAQNLGQNRPKPLKSKRSRRELSNGVVESLIRRDVTPVMVLRGAQSIKIAMLNLANCLVRVLLG